MFFFNFLCFFFSLNLIFTFQPEGNLYASFAVFCPNDRLDDLQLLFDEDTLIDWARPISLNFTHADIVARMEEFYEGRGQVEKLYGDIYSLMDNVLVEEDEIDT